MTRRYAVTLHKGGVGKTTTAVNLAGVLAQDGNQVLVVDCDSQGDLSSVFLDNHETLPHSVADIFAQTGVVTADLVQPTAFENLAIIPADRRLEAFEQTHDFKATDAVYLLADAIEQVQHQYDYVIFDTATRPHLTGYAALVASDVAVIPLEAARFSFRSVGSIRAELELESDARSYNPALQIRYFISKRKKGKVLDACRDALIETLGEEAVLETDIPDSAAINTALHLRKPIALHSKKSKPAQAYRSLLLELSEVTHATRTNNAAA